jgi:DNA-binding XRE family transcriptional regulator
MGLREMRVESGMRQYEAADLFGISHATYQNYELGKTSPTMETAAAMARHFGCTIGDLFDLEEGRPDELTAEERAILADFRALRPTDRMVAARVVNALAYSKGEGAG